MGVGINGFPARPLHDDVLTGIVFSWVHLSRQFQGIVEFGSFNRISDVSKCTCPFYRLLPYTRPQVSDPKN
jgi:hypothetical protein